MVEICSTKITLAIEAEFVEKYEFQCVEKNLRSK